MNDTSSADLNARIAELEQRLKGLERRERAQRRLADLLSDIFPSEVRTHLKAAQREQLMAARSFLDHWIERMDERETPRGRESITVD
jgi:septal ring factor EnvC (AmiA/AmiB activator)